VTEDSRDGKNTNEVELSTPSSRQPPPLWPLAHPFFAMYAFSSGGNQFGWKSTGFEITRTTLMRSRVLHTEPLTEAGWNKIWRTMTSDFPLLAVAVSEACQRSDVALSTDQYASELKSLGSLATLQNCVLLGGYGYEESLTAGMKLNLYFTEEGLWASAQRTWKPQIRCPYSEARALEFSGPGRVRTGGGFIGGGFGLSGAAEGMIVASVLNSLTTRSSIQSIVRWEARTMEAFFFTSEATPGDLRIKLSPVMGCIRSGSVSPASSDLLSEIERLAALHRQGVLDDDEFSDMKKRIISGH
jgi:hypothetical protein